MFVKGKVMRSIKIIEEIISTLLDIQNFKNFSDPLPWIANEWVKEVNVSSNDDNLNLSNIISSFNKIILSSSYNEQQLAVSTAINILKKSLNDFKSNNVEKYKKVILSRQEIAKRLSENIKSLQGCYVINKSLVKQMREDSLMLSYIVKSDIINGEIDKDKEIDAESIYNFIDNIAEINFHSRETNLEIIKKYAENIAV